MSLIDREPLDLAAIEPIDGQELVRQRAIKQIERRPSLAHRSCGRRDRHRPAGSIWGSSEYHDAGGRPSHGLRQSSGVHDAWNVWVIYTLIALGRCTSRTCVVGARRKPISQNQIKT